MQKTATLLLAAYAALASTILLLGVVGPQAQAPGPSGSGDGGDVGTALRDAVTRARYEAQRVYRANVLKQDARLERLESLRREMAEELKEVDAWVESVGRRNAGDMQAIDQKLAAVERLRAELHIAEAVLEALSGRIKSVEAFGARVKALERELAAVRAAVAAGRGRPLAQPTQPDVPRLPVKRAPDPAQSAAKIKAAEAGLQSEKLTELWSAIEVMRKYKVTKAAPRLIEILSSSKEKLARQAAATALGEMRWADAMLPLADALKDDAGVAQMAAKAINHIAEAVGHVFVITHSARAKERTRLRNEVLAWWRSNEAPVRAELGQPKG